MKITPVPMVINQAYRPRRFRGAVLSITSGARDEYKVTNLVTGEVTVSDNQKDAFELFDKLNKERFV